MPVSGQKIRLARCSSSPERVSQGPGPLRFVGAEAEVQAGLFDGFSASAVSRSESSAVRRETAMALAWEGAWIQGLFVCLLLPSPQVCSLDPPWSHAAVTSPARPDISVQTVFDSRVEAPSKGTWHGERAVFPPGEKFLAPGPERAWTLQTGPSPRSMRGVARLGHRATPGNSPQGVNDPQPVLLPRSPRAAGVP